MILNIQNILCLCYNEIFSEIYSKIVELEEELRVVGNNLKSLEVSEEKVCDMMFPIKFMTILHK